MWGRWRPCASKCGGSHARVGGFPKRNFVLPSKAFSILHVFTQLQWSADFCASSSVSFGLSWEWEHSAAAWLWRANCVRVSGWLSARVIVHEDDGGGGGHNGQTENVQRMDQN